MKAVVQRTKQVVLSVDGQEISRISGGLAVYFGVAVGDTLAMAEALAKKIVNMRIFEDENGKMNLSVKDVGGEILCISQFTLLADTSHGNRPGFTEAERPETAKPMYDHFCTLLASYGVPVKKGVFGADMKINQLNDGPVTIILESK